MPALVIQTCHHDDIFRVICLIMHMSESLHGQGPRLDRYRYFRGTRPEVNDQSEASAAFTLPVSLLQMADFIDDWTV
jgi:hypothetical protein